MDISGLMTEAPYIAALVIIVMVFVKNIEAVRAKQAESEALRDQQWRDFLTEQRTQTTSALSRLSAEISSVSTAVATVHSEQLRHDAWMRESVDVMKSRAKNAKQSTRTAE